MKHDTRDLKVGQQPDIILQDGTLAMGGQSIEPATEADLHKEYLDALAFMEEPIEIMVHESTDQNAPNPITVGNNGQFCQFFRGVPKVAKRKFVDCLLVKNSTVSTPEFINTAGERAFLIKRKSAPLFPFSVVRDPNPKGLEWLRQKMAEAI